MLAIILQLVCDVPDCSLGNAVANFQARSRSAAHRLAEEAGWKFLSRYNTLGSEIRHVCPTCARTKG